MLAVSRYHLALLGHSQRYLPAVLAYLTLCAILYTDPSSPVLPLFGVSAGGLLVVGCWLTIAVLDIEDPVQRLITLSHARGRGATIGGAVLAVLACVLVLTLVTVGWSVALTGELRWSLTGTGLLAHLSCALLGIAIGLPCSRLLIARIGWTVLIGVLALGVVLLGKWVPLVHPLLQALMSGTSYAGPLALATGTALAGLALSAVVVGRVCAGRA
ncbi:hypothetical protein [Amycolatopsis jiangsuensis]|uniref:ABC-2 type transport system permease protein n=1 Tax=Amycolatopsis jiangsuensis TaxID=1181879 RepID=A0A840J0M8_9PSEU|nr:hypothetical protein [Amycolatopsis jiangsuensis]MBB4687185.1 hypothetical protein [Amycolatopsis jiangsuensis]